MDVDKPLLVVVSVVFNEALVLKTLNYFDG